MLCGLPDNERKYLPLSLVFIHFSFTHPEQKCMLRAKSEALSASFLDFLDLEMNAIRSFYILRTLIPRTQRDLPQDFRPYLCKQHGC